MIRHIPLKHGWYYFYRIHELRCKELTNGFSKLADYLNFVAKNCPNEYFTKGPRSSMLTLKLKNLKVHPIEGHEISNLARVALKDSGTRDAHTNVEMFLLNNDEKTIAVEIPLWLENNEIPGFKELFKSTLPLTGHIDILRVENDKIWIWDYKPNAKKEKYATTQTFFYAYMLSKRSKIPLKDFRCGYFDSNFAFVFDPNKVSLVNDNTLANFI